MSRPTIILSISFRTIQQAHELTAFFQRLKAFTCLDYVPSAKCKEPNWKLYNSIDVWSDNVVCLNYRLKEKNLRTIKYKKSSFKCDFITAMLRKKSC